MEHLDAVVLRVGHGDAGAVGRPGRGRDPHELPRRIAERRAAGDVGAERIRERAVAGVEHLDAAVAALGRGDERAVGRPGGRLRATQLAGAVAVRSDHQG